MMENQENYNEKPAKTFEEEVAEYTPKADAGDVNAMYDLGMAYNEEGERLHSKKLHKKAHHYLKMAAKAGDIEAHGWLGIMASEGIGTRKNDADAKFYLEKYIQERKDDQLGNLLGACYLYLGQLYVAGQGTRRNVPRGYAYIQKAAEIGGEGTEEAEEYLNSLRMAYPFREDGSIDLSARGRNGLATFFLLIGVLGSIFGLATPSMFPEAKANLSSPWFYGGMALNLVAYLGVLFWQRWAGWLMLGKLIFWPIAMYVSFFTIQASIDNGIYGTPPSAWQSFCLALMEDGLLVLFILLMLQRAKMGRAAAWCSLFGIEDDGRNVFTRLKDLIMVYGEGDDYRMHSVASKTFITTCYAATGIAACVALFVGWRFITADVDWGMDINWKCWESPQLWGFLSVIGFFAQFFDWRHLSFREGLLIKQPNGKKKFVPDDDILSVLFGTLVAPLIGHFFIVPLTIGAMFYYIIMGALALLGAFMPYAVALLCLLSAIPFFKGTKHLYPRRWRVPLLAVFLCIYTGFLLLVGAMPKDGSKFFGGSQSPSVSLPTEPQPIVTDDTESGVLGGDIVYDDDQEEPEAELEQEYSDFDTEELQTEETQEEAIPDSILSE